MSLQESSLLILAGLSLLVLVNKWAKSLMVVVMMEVLTIVLLSFIYTQMGGMTILLMVLFTFFVGEALILLSSLFSMLRLIGMSYSALAMV